MEVVRLGIVLAEFKPSCSTKRWRQRVPANTYFDNNILFIIGCLMLFHRVIVHALKALESSVINTFITKLL